jgi:uncharacterized protein YhaN
MRIDRLRLIAWGAFRNLVLDLSAGKEGVHAILGPNEAGKSCALRAIRALLFGMPHSCPDAFVHDQRTLAVGATLRRANDDSLSFVRKKARTNSLIDEHGDVIPDAALLPFLGSIDAGLFESLFGIDHDALRSGADALLAENGHVGQAIVAASAGYRDLGGVIRELEEQAEKLFKSGRGRTPVINAALVDLKAESDRMTEATVRFSKYQEAMKDMDAAEAEQKRISTELQQLRTTAGHLDRYRKALPVIAKEGVLRAELEDLGAVVALPEGFAIDRQKVEGNLRNASEAAESARTALEGIESDRGALLVPDRILEQAEAIAALAERLGAHKKGVTDAPGLRARLEEAERDVYNMLRDLGRPASLDEVDKLRVPAPARARVQELGGKLPLLEQQLQQARDRQAELVEDIRRADEERSALGPVIDLSDLRSVVEAAQAEGDLDRLLAKTTAQLQKEEAQTTADISKLGLVRAPIDQFGSLAVPLEATIERFQNEWTSVGHELRTGKDRLSELQKEAASTEAELATLRLSGATPTEQDLLQSRQTRDNGWNALRTAWSAGAPAEVAACDEYGEKVRVSDEVADRLRRESDRVTKQAALLAQGSKQDEEISGLTAHLAVLDNRQQALVADWTAAWAPAGIVPLSPVEMRSWTQKYAALVNRAAEVRDHRAEVKTMTELIERRRRSLLAAIELVGQRADPSSDDLGSAIRSAKSVLGRLDTIETGRQSLTRKLADLDGARVKADGHAKSANEEQGGWKESWTQAVATALMPEHTTPVEAMAILSRTQDTIEKANSASSLRHRLQGIDADAAEFVRDVETLVERAAPDLATATAAQAAATLHARLQEARENAARRAELEKARMDRDKSKNIAVAMIERCERRLAELCAIAGCATIDDLAPAEQRANRHAQLQQGVREIRLQLATLAGASEVDSFIVEASKEDPDALTARIEETEQQIENLDGLRRAQEETIGGLKVRREQMQGGSNAALGAENVESVRARVRDAVERYLQTRIASAILRREVELYRKAHQGPIMKRASELFSSLTVGSFGGIEIEYGDDGKPSIVGARPGVERLSINQLSDGTRDQLFLSLRLASIEGYLERNEPIPFIVDDIFVHFDDRRAAAALEVLGELSKKTQVIVFTHHQHLIEVAKGTACAKALVVHTI